MDVKAKVSEFHIINICEIIMHLNYLKCLMRNGAEGDGGECGIMGIEEPRSYDQIVMIFDLFSYDVLLLLLLLRKPAASRAHSGAN